MIKLDPEICVASISCGGMESLAVICLRTKGSGPSICGSMVRGGDHHLTTDIQTHRTEEIDSWRAQEEPFTPRAQEELSDFLKGVLVGVWVVSQQGVVKLVAS